MPSCWERGTIACTVFLATGESWILELLAFDEYCRFDTSAFFMHIKRTSLYTHKAKVSKRQYSSKANSSNIRDFAMAKNTVLNLVLELVNA